MGLKEPQASKTSGTRRVAILDSHFKPLSKKLGGNQKRELLTLWELECKWEKTDGSKQVQGVLFRNIIQATVQKNEYFIGICLHKLCCAILQRNTVFAITLTTNLSFVGSLSYQTAKQRSHWWPHWEETQSTASLCPFLIGTHKAVRSTGRNICGGILLETDTGGGERTQCREPKVKLTATSLNTLFWKMVNFGHHHLAGIQPSSQ